MRASGRVAAVCAALAVGACGGNGDSYVPSLPSEASPAAWVENLSALHSIDNETYVGSGVIESLDHSSRVGIPGETVHGSAAVLHGNFRNGVGRDRLASYLTADALEQGMSGSGGRVSRFADPPVVRVAQLASEQHVYDVRTALQMINSSLPNDWQILFDASAVAEAHQAAQPDGEIVIGFDRRENWSVDGCGGDAIGCAQTWRSSSRGTWEIVGGLIWIDHTRIESRHERVATIVHEILHVLGREHPDPYDFPDSIMIEILQENSGFMLSQLDREALLAVYGHLDPGTRAADIYRELGTWEDTSTAVLGGVEIPGGWIGFGAAEMNEHVQAWAYGPTPWTYLADNTELHGNANWSGRLLGLTPASRAVAGAADLTVRLATLDGDAAFTGMESWMPDVAPGATGSGTTWGDGDLHYPIEVGGNQFWRTWESGDDGALNGSFFGIAHEGMGGVLRRDDLTAAFGGKR